jgi:hypothetical protein
VIAPQQKGCRSARLPGTLERPPNRDLCVFAQPLSEISEFRGRPHPLQLSETTLGSANVCIVKEPGDLLNIKKAIPANAVARAIAFAMEQPDDVDINDIVVRPSAQVI